MSFFRYLYNFLLAGSQAYARWDFQTSRNILNNRKKLLWLLFLAIPIFLACIVEAAAPEMLGSHSAYGPAFYTKTIFLTSIGIGMGAGLITGVIGAGGGFIITPALMAVGVKGILAVGTDLFHIFAKAIMGSSIHGKLGNISVKLAFVFLIGSILGTFGGGAINKTLYDANPLLSDVFISSTYALLLGFLGIYALYDFIKSSRTMLEEEIQAQNLGNLAKKVQSWRIPPMINFDEKSVSGGRNISAWVVMAGGSVVGFLAAIMGVGGGFVTFPMFVYIFGVSSMTTVGTDIFQIIFTAGFAAIGQYAIYGFVFYTLAIGMLLGSLIGIQIGALTTSVVDDMQIRGFYAVSILSGFFNRIASLPKKLAEMEVISWPAVVVNGIETVGNWIFWAVVIFFACWIFWKFFGNLGILRATGDRQ